MNMAALLCASVLDLFRVKLRHGFNIASLPANHFLNDGTRLLLFTGGPLANLLRPLPSCQIGDPVQAKHAVSPVLPRLLAAC